MIPEFYNPDTQRNSRIGTDVHLPTFGLKCVTASFTRPADTTAYAVNDSVNSSTSAPAAMNFADATRSATASGYIKLAQIYTDQVANTAGFRLHLFTASPTLVNDNEALTALYANLANRIGHIEFPALKSAGTGSTMAFAQVELNIPFCSATTSIYGTLECLNIFTPASAQKFTLKLMIDRS